MSEEERTRLERAIARAFRPQRRLSRRAFMRQAGRGGAYAAGALSLPSILAACGIGAQTASPSTAPGGSAAATPAPVGGGEPSGTLIFANWELYIDVDDETGERPSLAAFTEATGIEVNYTEDYNDNDEFFAKVQPQLSGGQDTGRDVWCSTDWLVARLIRLG
jgi:spermidine/putrescine transport system substrate-binding protein